MKKIFYFTAIFLFPAYLFGQDNGGATSDDLYYHAISHLQEASNCYNDYLKTPGSLPHKNGVIYTRFTVSSSGNISSIQVTSTNFTDSLLINCVIDRIRQIKFPVPEKPDSPISLPVRFSTDIPDAFKPHEAAKKFFSEHRQIFLDLWAIYIKAGLIISFLLSFFALHRIFRHIKSHWKELIVLVCVAFCLRFLFADFHSSSEQWPYITQAACISYPDAVERFNLCRYNFFGDVHQIGTAILFSFGFLIFGAYKASAGFIVLVASLLNTLLVYGLTVRLFHNRRTGFAAALLYAVFPSAIYFAGATETEIFNDTFLLLGVMLLIRDYERFRTGCLNHDRISLKIADSVFFRAFFLVVAINIRPELLFFLPLFIFSYAFFCRPLTKALKNSLYLLIIFFLLVMPAAFSFFLKIDRVFLSPDTVLGLIEVYFSDMLSLVTGSVVLIVLIIVSMIFPFVPGINNPFEAKFFAAITIFINGLYIISQGMDTHCPPHQLYIVYHGTVLFFPLVSFCLFRSAALFSSGFNRFLNQKANAAIRFLITFGPAFIFYFVPPHPFVEDPEEYLNTQIHQKKMLADRIPQGSSVILIPQDFFSGSEIAAILLQKGIAEIYHAHDRDEEKPLKERICEEMKDIIKRADSRNAKTFLVDIVPDKYLDFLEGTAGNAVLRCSIGLTCQEQISGYKIYEMKL
jgi:4-amino-4-deoxy-L-arabinose transferase-like glycosyltransferase